MKVICQDALGANRFISLSYHHAFEGTDHQSVFWTGDDAFDLFNSFEPDIYFGHTWRLTRAIVKCLIKRPHIKVILRAPHYGDYDVDRAAYPIQFATPEEIELTQIVRDNCPNLLLTCQYPNEFVQQSHTHNHWDKMGAKCVGVLLGVDTTDYFPEELDDNYKRDIVMVGGAWQYKLQTMGPYLYQFAYPSKFSCVFAGDGWGGPNAVGRVSEQAARKLYSNSIVCPNVHEPHSSFIPDINQRLLQVPAAFGFQIAQKVAGLDQLFTQDELETVDTPEEMLAKVEYYVKNPDERNHYIKAATLRTYAEHTNYHRLADVAELIDELNLASQCDAKAMEIYQMRKEQLEKRFG